MSQEPIASTKERLGSYDAIQSAKPGEPLFPIQGGDPFGPPTVLHWAKLARTAGMDETDPKKAEHLLRKASDAEQVAWQMQAYQRGDVQPDSRRATYNDAAPIAEASEARNEREARIKAAAALHNALAIAQVQAEVLANLRCCPEQEVLIREAVQNLRDAAFGIEPRRGMERS